MSLPVLRKPTRRSRPETIGEAEAWQARKNAYFRALDCHRCASLLAFLHRDGFATAEAEPCGACRPLVDAFPEGTAHPTWRKWPRGRVPASLTLPSAPPDLPDPDRLRASETGAEERAA